MLKVALIGVVVLALGLVIGALVLLSRKLGRERARASARNANFAELYADFPEQVRAWVQREDCWVFDPEQIPPGVSCSGPYRVECPATGRSQEVFGIGPACEESLDRLRDELGRVESAH